MTELDKIALEILKLSKRQVDREDLRPALARLFNSLSSDTKNAAMVGYLNWCNPINRD